MKIFSLIALVGIVAGCSASSLNPLPLNDACASSSDCEGAQICRYDVCVVADPIARQIGFQLVPSNSSLFRPQVVAPAVIDFEEPLTIALRPSIRVEGKLLFRGLDGRVSASGPPGVLTFRGTDTAFTVPPTQTAIGNDLGYSVLLLPGRYTVSFKADDPDVPSKVWEPREFLLDTNPELTIAQDPVRLQGTLRDASILGRRQVVPIVGARLVAVSRDTGSTTTVTETNAVGEFIMGVLPYSGLYDLRVTQAKQDDMLDEFEFDNAFECINERCIWNLSDGENLELSILSIMGERHDAVFVLTGPGEARPNWTGTSVTLEGDFAWGRVRMTRPVSATGDVKFPVPVGAYDLTVLPADDFPLSRHRTSLEVTADSLAREIAVPARTLVEARVLDAAGEPLSDALVEFEEITSGTKTISQTSDDAGRIALPLDLYDYWVTITPNATSLPPTVRFLRASTIQSERRMEFRVAEPVVLVGDVLGAPTDSSEAWVGVTDVAIQPFEIVAGRAVKIGEATTREDGRFKMLISSLTPEQAP